MKKAPFTDKPEVGDGPHRSEMRTIPEAERPRERCLSQGARCLSLRECLAVILGSGTRKSNCLETASRILDLSAGDSIDPDPNLERGFFTAMESSPGAAFEQIPGLGPSQRAKLMAVIEIARRFSNFRQQRRLRLRRPLSKLSRLPADALSKVSLELRTEAYEWLGFVPVFKSGELGCLTVAEKGSRTHVNTDPAELFARILPLRPAGLFLFHNHPSGDLTPSPQDQDLTRRVAVLCAQFGIRLLGHWVVSAIGEHWINETISENMRE